MKGLIGVWTERLQRHLLAGVEADIARLEREVATQRDALGDPERLRRLIGTGLWEEADALPEHVVAALRPVVEDMLRRRSRERGRRLRVVAAVAAVAAGSASLVCWWRSDLWIVSLASAAKVEREAPASQGAAAQRSADLEPVGPVIIEERGDAFGLARAPKSDVELTPAVRTRLGNCAQLAGAQVSFAVKDGWVWLRGEASEAAREAADRALADLGDGVVVINQIEVGSRQVVAER